MLQFINDLPDYVVGIHAVGKVTKDEYERVLVPRIDDLVKRQGEINFLLVLETDVHFSVGFWWEDLKLGLKNFTKWNKIAVVTDQKSIEWFSDIFKFFIPFSKSKSFRLNELDKAIGWISETEDQDFQGYETISAGQILEEIEMRSSNKGQGPSGENL
jgi:hypothetical protein